MNQSRTTKRNSKYLPEKVNLKLIKINKKKYRCRECMKSYSSKQSLREHKYSHSNQKPYLCLICGKSFKFGSQLCIHRKSHCEIEGFVNLNLTDLRPSTEIFEKEIVVLNELVRIPPIRSSQSFTLPKISDFLE